MIQNKLILAPIIGASAALTACNVAYVACNVAYVAFAAPTP